MKILILGSGVIGVTTAYFLSKRGHDVTVIDREPESARECSFANGGQLSYTHAEPWANPKSLKKAIQWIGKKDAPLMFRFRADYHMWRWACKFLWNCRKKATLKNTETMLRLGLYSREIMHRLQDELHLDYHYTQCGILHFFTDQYALDCATRQAEFQKDRGAPYELLTKEQCLEKEPALKARAHELVGGIYDCLDESGDVFMFTKALAERDKKKTGESVTFQYDTTITGLRVEGNRIAAVQTDKGDMEADVIVMSLGAYSPVFLRKIGIDVPIYPMKGYSISVPMEGYDGAPNVSITDQKDKIVYSRLGNVFRVAGTAEFAGYDHSVNPYRIQLLKEAVRKNFPDAGDIDNATEWACLRPSTPDGPPILGRCRYENLILNTGHGTLGWTQSAGSARIVADIIEGKTPEIAMDGLTVDRF